MVMVKQVNIFKRRKTLWKQIKRGHDRRSHRREAGPTKETSQPFTINSVSAKKKLEQLKLLTATDLDIVNSAEPFRVAGYILFKRHLLDVPYCIAISIIYLVCYVITRGCSNLSFFLIFFTIFWTLHRQITSYRSFALTRQCASILGKDHKLRRIFLSTHLGHNPSRQVKLFKPNGYDRHNHGTDSSGSELSLDEPEAIAETPIDTFHWINKILRFFWPYISHLIHFELNEFFRNQIESGSLGRSSDSSKRLFYAIIRQVKTNILVIEECQLGDRAPHVKNLTVFEEEVTNENKASIGRKNIVYDLDLEYNGDMNISVIYRYFCCCNQRIGLKDIFLRFKIRLILGPIKDDIPFIEQISLTLLELPQFGYKGIALAELAELRVVRGVINGLIKDNILNPRKLTVNLGELLEKFFNGPPPPLHEGKEQDEKSRKVSGGANQHDVSFMTRLAAKALLCGCMCSNILLRSCQERGRPTASRDEEDDDD